MSTAKIVGHRLRRYLGALLAVGFGATWWNLVPPAQAAALTIQEASKPKVVVAPVVTPEPEDPPIHVSMRLPDPKPKHHHRVVTPTVVVTDPPIVALIDLQPVTAPIVVPVSDPIVIPEPDPEPLPVPRIRTRSS
jgi:hypothetical protein